MADPDFLLSLGIRVQDVMAGMAGGVVNAFVFKRSDPVSIIGSVTVGALTANYLGETVGLYLQHVINISPGASSFITGLGGMALCQAIIAGIARVKFNRFRDGGL